MEESSGVLRDMDRDKVLTCAAPLVELSIALFTACGNGRPDTVVPEKLDPLDERVSRWLMPTANRLDVLLIPFLSESLADHLSESATIATANIAVALAVGWSRKRPFKARCA